MGGHTQEGKEMIFCFQSESMIYLLPSLNGQCIVLLLQTMLLTCLFFLVFQFACESCYKVNRRKNQSCTRSIYKRWKKSTIVEQATLPAFIGKRKLFNLLVISLYFFLSLQASKKVNNCVGKIRSGLVTLQVYQWCGYVSFGSKPYLS